MQVYKAGDQWVIGLKGGWFMDIKKDPEAVILNHQPIPSKKWYVPIMKDEEANPDERWEYEYTFREFHADGISTYIFEIEFSKDYPDYSRGEIEYFVTKEYVEKQVEWLRSNRKLAEYIWDPVNNLWVEMERNFKYEDEEEEESLCISAFPSF